MAKALGVLFILALAGCGGMPAGNGGGYSSTVQCSSPTLYECQVEMYMKAGG